MLENKNVLMVLAHPDDELIFGWPVFQDEKINKFYLCCSTDEFNNARAWCSHRKEALFEICKKNNVSLWTIPAPSDFYKLNSRRKKGTQKDAIGDATSDLRIFKNLIINTIEDIVNKNNIDYIFTHNPFGEYGHLDHIFLFDTVIKKTKKPILITDITIRTNWDDPKISNRMKKIFYNNMIKEKCEINLEFYEKNKKLYIDKGVWTWSRDKQEEFKKCNLYMVE